MAKTWTNEELAWKFDYEGADYLLTQVDPNDVEDPNVAQLLFEIKPLFKELTAILNAINLEEL